MKKMFRDQEILSVSPDDSKIVVYGHGHEPRMSILLSCIEVYDRVSEKLLVKFPSDAVNWTVIKQSWRDDNVLKVDLEHYPTHKKLIGVKINFEKNKIHIGFGEQQFSVDFSHSAEALNKIDETIS